MASSSIRGSASTFGSMRTRLRQGITALVATRTRLTFPERYRASVPSTVAERWERLSPYDQHHLVAVAEDLRRSSMPETVVLAGLLHDIGKPGGVWLPARAGVVLLSRFAPTLADRIQLSNEPLPGLQGLHLLLTHAEHGARFLEENGVRPQVTWLVRHHESTASHPYLIALQAADHRL